MILYFKLTSGHDSDYKPWLTVRDLGSEGRSHRIFGHKSQRTHHLLSDLELAVFLMLEWHSDTLDIREQFPLQLTDTMELAQEAGIIHPSMNGVKQIMTSDFLVNSKDPARPKFALQAKYASALEDPRTIEKLELERRYWQHKNIPWMIITEQDIPKVVSQNINWLYPAQREELNENIISDRIKFYTYHFKQSPEQSIIEIAKKLDMSYELPQGQSLLEIRQLLAKRILTFDILKPCLKLKASDLTIGNLSIFMEVLHVSNQ